MIMFVNGMIDRAPEIEGCNIAKKIFSKQFDLIIFARLSIY